MEDLNVGFGMVIPKSAIRDPRCLYRRECGYPLTSQFMMMRNSSFGEGIPGGEGRNMGRW